MDVSTWIARNAERVRIDGKAVFRQGRTKGSWKVVDLSRRGLSARGPLKGLDTTEPVEVRVQVGSAAFIAQVVCRWKRPGEWGHAHGWELLSVREASARKLEAIVEPGSSRGLRSKRFGKLLAIA